MTSPAPAGDAFNALADPIRRNIVALLHDGERSVQELADALPVSRPAVSRHLRLLKDAGLVTDRSEGTRRVCRLDEAGVERMRAYLDEMWGSVSVRYRIAVENTSDEGLA
ncbi:MAG: metalloregulator ArsR/SmtB family transcription factor [Acidimicrobiia bacterium]|nr:metalloregulator ArsR/SmtB family transcription factor [Acidimicrobiia bacterium]